MHETAASQVNDEYFARKTNTYWLMITVWRNIPKGKTTSSLLEQPRNI